MLFAEVVMFSEQQKTNAKKTESSDANHADRVLQREQISLRSLRRQIKNDAAVLRKAVRNDTGQPLGEQAHEWLADNYHLLISSCNDCLQTLRQADLPPFVCAGGSTQESISCERGQTNPFSAGDLFLLCLSVCENGVLPPEDLFFERLAKQDLCVAQCLLLPCTVCLALLHTAANAVRCTCDEVLINTVRSLLRLREFDFLSEWGTVSVAERKLRQDPADVYANMDDGTKDAYRRQVARLAQKTGRTEAAVLDDALAKAKEENRHIGFYLSFSEKSKAKSIVFTVSQWVLTVFLSVLIAWAVDAWWVFFLLFLPVLAVLRAVFDRLVPFFFESRPLFSMRVEREIPDGAQTVLTVCGLLPSAKEATKTEKHLAELYEANGFGAVKVLFLADMSEADSPDKPSDKADMAAMCRCFDRLNARFGGGFVLAVRPRLFSATQRAYAGMERKRGALLQLSAWLCEGKEEPFCLLYGDTKGLRDTRYICTLDSDTTLTFGSLPRLCAVAMHPLNAPSTDSTHTKVISGYAAFVPAAHTALQNEKTGLFSLLMTDGGGSGAYSAGVSERNMDVFGQSIFTGKGLLDVRVFYDLCADRFPPQRILSHDVLEGGILRTAFEGRAGITEHFPANERSYFERMHRWLRGDWQNIRFVLHPLGKTKLPSHTRYLLAENGLRALTPVAQLALLFGSLFLSHGKAALLIAVALVSVCAGEFFSLCALVCRQGFSSLTKLYFSRRVPGAAGILMRAFLLCAMLPQTAWCALTAAVTSFWRLNVSRKNLLAWKTAAFSDRSASASVIRSVVFPLAVCVLLFFGSHWHRLTAMLFAVHLPLAAGVPLPTADRFFTLSRSRRAMLVSDCAAMWRFFEDNADEADHFLPPDNVQETPLRKVAHRTSPTNIGLYLCCILAAADLAFIDAQELCRKVSRCLDTVEKLEKVHGHLLNWYDTQTLCAMHPRYVSTVDSGNFVCCLTALQEGLKEYLHAEPVLQTQIDRIENILQQTDFRPLYNEKRHLFYVGMDADLGEKSSSCYDLYMSEARMTSYWCISRAQVPAEHWQALGRTQVSADRYAGAVSWTGTFFEYFMPCLFLPVRPNSFAAESLSFCLHVQRKYAKKHNIPWGLTESGFYSFDPAMNYAYKAHGVKTLALKRHADCEPVVAPYASFLALPVFPDTAVRNLEKLRAMHLTGKYGFCEAADFTQNRTGGEDYCTVRSYMAHHLGMSMLSAVNALNGLSFVQRFMRNAANASASELFNERVPMGEKLYRSVQKKDGFSRPVRPDRREKCVPQNVQIASDGEWTSLCDRYARSVQIFSSHRVLRKQGFGGDVSIACAENGKLMPLAGHPSVHCSFGAGSVHGSCKTEHFRVRTAIAVHPSLPASLFAVRADHAGEQKNTLSLLFYLEPYLRPVFAKNSHPAYEKLFIACRYDADEKIFTFTRHGEDGTLCAAVGFWDNADFTFETDREKVLPREGAQTFAVTDSFLHLENGSVGTDRCLALCLPMELGGSQSAEHTLIVTAAAEESEAAARIRAVRAKPLPDAHKCAKNPFSDDAMLMQTAENLCAGLFFDAPPTASVCYARKHNETGKNALWSLGISGDRPIAVLETDADEEPSLPERFVRLHAKLCAIGIPTDFVYLRGRSGGYSESAQAVLKQICDRVGLPHAGGQMIALQKNTFHVSVLQTLCSYAESIYPTDLAADRKPVFVQPPQRLCVAPAKQENGFTENGYVFFETPPVPWCGTYANPVFGCLCSDSSPGFTWAGNAHMNKITPWSNDTRAKEDGEELLMGLDGQTVSLTAGAACLFTDRFARYEGQYQTLHTVTDVATDAKAQKKRISVHLTNASDTLVTCSLFYAIRPLLGEDITDARFVKGYADGGAAVLYNPVNTDVPGFLRLSCDSAPSCVAFSERELENYLHRKTVFAQTEDFLAPDTPPDFMLTDKTAVGTQLSLQPGQTVCVCFTMSFARTQQAAKTVENNVFRLPAVPKTQFHTDNKTLDSFGNSLLLSAALQTRLYARCGFYQCGGAWGFRDQLQDALCLMPYAPQLTRRQILRCAAVQFLQGDVLHWHHALYPKGEKTAVYRGVRTRCADDFLWLVYVAAEYVFFTGDTSVLHVKVPYLEGKPLQKGEKDRYAQFAHGSEKETLYSHCLRAVSRALRFGENGLSLMFGGDWNDAMGKVGALGKGESVWLSMFASLCLSSLGEVSQLIGETKNSIRLRKLAEMLKGNIDRFAWEGDRYLRAFFDDGTPIGSASSEACKLDVLPQAFAVFCNMPDKKRVRTALATAYNTLFDRKNGLVKLFDGAFTPQHKTAGYINFYPPGVRENAGQYTHAAVWFALALLQAGFREQAMEIAKAICPATRYENGVRADTALVYRSEPYAPCGDVLSAKGMAGRGGWSLYTGSAGWWLTLLDKLSRE